MENIGNWTLKIVVHHSGESPIGDKYDFKSSIEIPLSAKTRKMAIAEAEKIIDEMDVEKLKAIYEPEIDDEDAITINEFQIAFSQKVNRPMKSIQQWF